MTWGIHVDMQTVKYSGNGTRARHMLARGRIGIARAPQEQEIYIAMLAREETGSKAGRSELGDE